MFAIIFLRVEKKGTRDVKNPDVLFLIVRTVGKLYLGVFFSFFCVAEFRGSDPRFTKEGRPQCKDPLDILVIPLFRLERAWLCG